MVGWTLFAVGVVGLFVFPLLTTLVFMGMLIFVGIDASRQGATGGQIAAWVAGTFLFWILVFPVYLFKRNSLENSRVTCIVLAAIIAVLTIGVAILAVVAVLAVSAPVSG